jgi:hypothetical protein
LYPEGSDKPYFQDKVTAEAMWELPDGEAADEWCDL